jgi:ABC-2 type transport system permease protein
MLAGVGAWIGAMSQGINVGLGSMIGAGANVVPTALVTLGIGAVTFALAPRAAVRAIYSVVIGSLLIDLVASLIDGLQWLEHLSLFHYMALVPAQDPDPTTVVLNVTVGLGLCALALVLFSRRDLRSR